mmetsp:Transcript_94224/g.304968  ORF Transcript_94224/g.304968 Transcript_94224/m.304968 type:complete len:240 (+) Transcript_94224:142-861(+)
MCTLQVVDGVRVSAYGHFPREDIRLRRSSVPGRLSEGAAPGQIYAAECCQSAGRSSDLRAAIISARTAPLQRARTPSAAAGGHLSSAYPTSSGAAACSAAARPGGILSARGASQEQTVQLRQELLRRPRSRLRARRRACRRLSTSPDMASTQESAAWARLRGCRKTPRQRPPGLQRAARARLLRRQGRGPWREGPASRGNGRRGARTAEALRERCRRQPCSTPQQVRQALLPVGRCHGR